MIFQKYFPFALRTVKEEKSGSISRKSPMVLLTTLMTLSITCTTPFVATWFPWMILAQFTVTTCTEGRRQRVIVTKCSP